MKASLSTFPKRNLGDLCEINIGKTPSRSKAAYWGGENPWLSIADMNQGRRLWRTKEAITDAGVKASGIRIVPKNTLLLSYKLSIGKVGITERSLFTNEAIAALPIIDPSILGIDYLYWTLNTIDLLETSDRAAMGATLNKAKLKEIPIPLPPLGEQKRIAAILDAADALRTKRREALAQLDALLQSTFLTLFGDPVTNPMGWETPSLGSVCDVRDGTHDSPKYVNEGMALLTSKNFKDGTIDYTGANLISESDFIQINKRSKVDKGDLVMPMIGTIGNPVLVEQEPDFAIKNVALIKFKGKSPDNRFIRALLCSHYFDHITAQANRGGTQKFVALKDLRGMPIPLPPLPLQQKFAAIVESVESQKAAQRAHHAELDALFAALQHRAFRGEL